MESTIRIERYADQGRCVGHIDGRVVFVRFALLASWYASCWTSHMIARTVFGLAK